MLMTTGGKGENVLKNTDKLMEDSKWGLINDKTSGMLTRIKDTVRTHEDMNKMKQGIDEAIGNQQKLRNASTFKHK
jgi:hypothetical protein